MVMRSGTGRVTATCSPRSMRWPRPDKRDAYDLALSVEADRMSFRGFIEVDRIGRITDVEIEHVSIFVVHDLVERDPGNREIHGIARRGNAVTNPAAPARIDYDNLEPGTRIWRRWPLASPVERLSPLLCWGFSTLFIHLASDPGAGWPRRRRRPCCGNRWDCR